ncbi:MAG: sulfite exporter TauE/SafE family protein [Armatimonadota bacterium]|nr:sulfite exporter TauE/SafE family protein [Armatimonadota bacterium]
MDGGEGRSSALDPGVLAVLLGLVSLAYAALAWTDRLPEVSARGHRYLGLVVGLGAGVMGGTTGIFAPLFASYLHSLRLEKRAFVFWLAVAFTLGGLAQVVSYYRLGLYTPALAGYAAATFVPAVAGTQVGFWIQDRLPTNLFRRLVLLLVVASGLNLVARGLR